MYQICMNLCVCLRLQKRHYVANLNEKVPSDGASVLSKWRTIPLSGMQALRIPLEISFCKASQTYDELPHIAIIRLHVSPRYLSRQFVRNSEVFINDPMRVTHGDFEMPPMECPQSSATCGAQPSRAKRGPAARSAAAAEGGRRRRRPRASRGLQTKARMRLCWLRLSTWRLNTCRRRESVLCTNGIRSI